MRAFSDKGKPVFRQDTTKALTKGASVPALHLCIVCDAIPRDRLDLDNGYEHYSSIKQLRDSAGADDYCHLCQMFWESIATKQRFNVKGDPMLLEDWPIHIHAIKGNIWRGYDALELRSGDHSASSVNWSTAPTWHIPGTAGGTYPICSRLYLHLGDNLNALTYTSSALDTTSSMSMQQTKTWSDNCRKYHNHVVAATTLPTRVIDVSYPMPKLHVTGGIAEYTALSYCWGTSKATTTTSTNLHLHVNQGLNFAALPKTIQDTITITRALGIRYLWVDALCIIQGMDDAARRDWDVESARMAEVYGGASVTIIAATASDCNEGIFQPRTIINTSKLATDGFTHRQTWSAHRQLNTNSGLASQYNVRAWTLQEMVLSTRSLFFAPNMNYWKCSEGVVGEDCKAARFTTVRSMTKELAQQDWHAVVQEYSRRKLTNPDDKLTALSGLAFQYNQKHRYHYVAGLWQETLIRNLMWRTELCEISMPLPKTWRAPSWSWASTNECVDFDLAPGESEISDLGYRAQIKHDVHLSSTSPFGRLQSANLQVSGKLVFVKKWRVNAFHSAGDAVTEFMVVRAYIDAKPSWEQELEVDCECWLLFLTLDHGLVVTETDKGLDTYRRIGMFIVPRRSKTINLDTWPGMSLTLV